MSFKIETNQAQCISHFLLISHLFVPSSAHFFFLLLVTLLALWYTYLARLNYICQNSFWCTFRSHKWDPWGLWRVEMKQQLACNCSIFLWILLHFFRLLDLWQMVMQDTLETKVRHKNTRFSSLLWYSISQIRASAYFWSSLFDCLPCKL